MTTSAPRQSGQIKAFLDVIDPEKGTISYDEITGPDHEFLDGPIKNAPLASDAAVKVSESAKAASGIDKWTLNDLAVYASEVESVFLLSFEHGTVTAIDEQPPVDG